MIEKHFLPALFFFWVFFFLLERDFLLAILTTPFENFEELLRYALGREHVVDLDRLYRAERHLRGSTSQNRVLGYRLAACRLYRSKAFHPIVAFTREDDAH